MIYKHLLLFLYSSLIQSLLNLIIGLLFLGRRRRERFVQQLSFVAYAWMRSSRRVRHALILFCHRIQLSCTYKQGASAGFRVPTSLILSPHTKCMHITQISREIFRFVLANVLRRHRSAWSGKKIFREKLSLMLIIQLKFLKYLNVYWLSGFHVVANVANNMVSSVRLFVAQMAGRVVCLMLESK